MKENEILQQYAQGRRDFQGVNLSGLSFQNQDLSGANFSNAEIRSTNFRGATLQKTQFVGVKAGLQKRWMILLLIVVFILAFLSGFCFIIHCYWTSLILDTSNLDNMVIGWICSLFAITFLIILLRQGFLGAFAFIAIAVSFIGAVTFALFVAFTRAGVIAIAGELARSGIIAGAFGMALAFGIAVAGAIAFGIAGARAEALAGAIVIAGAIAGARAEAIAGARAITIAVTLIHVGVIFYMTYRAMKGDEKHALIRDVAVAVAAIGGTCFRGADLTEANFTNAILKNTDFREANLTRTLWKKAKQLDLARPGKSILAQWNVRELLVSGKGQAQDFSKADLRGANLSNTDLSYVNLTQADLSQGILAQANLEGANLTEINAIGTDLSEATLTAACIEAWNTDSTTRLDDIDCDYIYLLNHQQERRPSSGIFASGEFTKLFEEVFNTVDLIFQDGVNWKAFISAFKQVQIENEGTELIVQSIENKGDGVIVVKAQVPLDADKEKIHSDFTQNYELKLQALEREYKAQLQMKESEIESYKRESVNLMEVTKLLASRAINMESNPIVINESKGNLSIDNVGGDVKGIAAGENIAGVARGDTNIMRPSQSVEEVKVLFFAFNPKATVRLALDEEAREITQKIRSSEHRDALNFIQGWAVRPDDLLQTLNEHKPHIVHFSGHGNSTGEIILLDGNRQPKTVNTAALQALFYTFKEQTRVVILNACYSKVQAEAITEVIDCVIGMNTKIGDEAAIVFAASFYRAIGFGCSIQDAFEQARVALMLEGISEEDTPELLCREQVNPKEIILTSNLSV